MSSRPFLYSPFSSSTPSPLARRFARGTRDAVVPVKEMASTNSGPGPDVASLLALPFPAFAQTVARLLEKSGYSQVRLMKAMHGRGKGRNAHGGYDLQMVLPTRLTRGLVIAQVKQYKEAVPRSFVDELRGTMLRLGASQGLLITTSTFSASAVEAAQSAQHAAPVRLVDGAELSSLLRAHPETLEALPASGIRRLSRQEGDRLEREFLDGLGAPPNAQAQAEKPAAPEPEIVTLTLRVAVCLAPFMPSMAAGRKKTSGNSDPKGERRQQ